MKVYDVIAITGEYNDPQTGQQKPRFENAGAIVQNSEGKLTLLLKKTFNPAGLAEPDRDSVALLVREPQQRAQQAMQAQHMQPNGQSMTPQKAQQVPHADEFGDSIPF